MSTSQNHYATNNTHLFSLYQIFVILQWAIITSLVYLVVCIYVTIILYAYMYILWIFLFFRWATDFKDKLLSGEIPSLTKAKDIATVHWRNYSPRYDSKRAVQQPTANSGTGHRGKRSRQDDETQYQYRKRKAEQERLQTPEETQHPDARMG